MFSGSERLRCVFFLPVYLGIELSQIYVYDFIFTTTRKCQCYISLRSKYSVYVITGLGESDSKNRPGVIYSRGTFKFFHSSTYHFGYLFVEITVGLFKQGLCQT